MLYLYKQTSTSLERIYVRRPYKAVMYDVSVVMRKVTVAGNTPIGKSRRFDEQCLTSFLSQRTMRKVQTIKQQVFTKKG